MANLEAKEVKCLEVFDCFGGGAPYVSSSRRGGLVARLSASKTSPIRPRIIPHSSGVSLSISVASLQGAALISPLTEIDHPALHHKINAFQLANIFKRIAIYANNICIFSNLKRARIGAGAKKVGIAKG